MEEKILYSKKFLKNFRLRVKPNKSLSKKFNDRLKIFLIDPKNPLLKDHKLTGEKVGLRAFSVTGDYRVVYERKPDRRLLFIDIGTHNQVY